MTDPLNSQPVSVLPDPFTTMARVKPVNWPAGDEALPYDARQESLNAITFGSDGPEAKRYREVQLKKVVIGLLYEMDACLDYCVHLV